MAAVGFLHLPVRAAPGQQTKENCGKNKNGFHFNHGYTRMDTDEIIPCPSHTWLMKDGGRRPAEGSVCLL
jgi:hypothetical protein